MTVEGYQRDWTIQKLPGRLEAFIAAQTGDTVSVSGLRRLSAGLSWVTFSFEARITAGGETRVLELVLRIGPPDGLLAPFVARPEYLMLRALTNRPGLPLPHAYWYSDDRSVLGDPFLITGRVDGETPQPPWGAIHDEDKIAAENAVLARDFVDGLVAIHTFDWRNSPVAALDPEVTPANATRREVERWLTRIEGNGDRSTMAAMHFAARWLHAHAPVAPRVCIVHGDYRVGNFLVKDGRMTAVLDWELTHLGDPHEDLAWACARTWGGTGKLLGGRFDRAEFFRRYEEHSGIRVNHDVIRYYDVLTQFKMAGIQVGAVRHVQARRVHDVRMVAMALQLAPATMKLYSLIRAAS